MIKHDTYHSTPTKLYYPTVYLTDEDLLNAVCINYKYIQSFIYGSIDR